MNIKLKKCSGCGKDKRIWKNHNGNRYCKYCWQLKKPLNKKKPTSKTPIKPRSKKKTALDIVYTQLRKVFLSKHPSCEANLKGCTNVATDVHHTFWGSERGSTYLEVNTWKAVCRTCHSQIHDKLSAEESKALGLKNFIRDGSK